MTIAVYMGRKATKTNKIKWPMKKPGRILFAKIPFLPIRFIVATYEGLDGGGGSGIHYSLKI